MITSRDINNNHIKQYGCNVVDMMVQYPGEYVDSVEGTHEAGKTDSDVVIFLVYKQASSYLPRGVGERFPNLRSFFVHSTPLVSIDRKVFQNMQHVDMMDIFATGITYVPKDTFWDLRGLQFLGIAGWQLTYINSELLRGLTELRNFSASYNKLEMVGTSLFHDTVNMREINLRGNHLKTIGWKLVRSMPKLVTADFRENTCIDMRVENDSSINDKLTQEFAQKCAVTCKKSGYNFMQADGERFQMFDRKIERLTSENTLLKRERQSMNYQC